MRKTITRREALKSGAGIAGLLALTACGAAPQASSSAQPVAERSATAVPLVTEPGSKVRVTYWGSFSGKNGETEQALVERFNSSQDDVILEYQFQGNYEETAQKLTAALQSNTAPEVSLLSDVWWFRFYLAGALQPLDDLYRAAGIDTSDYQEVLFNEGVRQGVSYARRRSSITTRRSGPRPGCRIAARKPGTSSRSGRRSWCDATAIRWRARRLR